MSGLRLATNRALLLSLLVFYFLVLSVFLLWPFNFDFSRKNNAGWLENGNGIEFSKKGLLITEQAPKDLFKKLITGSGLTIEAWIEPQNSHQEGPARIISYSIDPYLRNFTLGQSGNTLILRLRTEKTDLNGLDRQLELKNVFAAKKVRHIVATYNFEKRCLYVDGKMVACNDQVKGAFTNWDSGHKLIIGNEATGNRPWLGKIYCAVLYNRALNENEVLQNFKAGYEKTLASIMSSKTHDFGAVATYLFDEKAGDTVFNQSGQSVHTDLHIPDQMPRGRKILMLDIKDNFDDISSINNLLINIFGFFPFGFFLCAYLKTYSHTTNKIIYLVLTVAIIISFGFEYLHYYLPKQHSSAVEVFLKMFGISLGMAAFYILHLTKKNKVSIKHNQLLTR